jgi:hypothetical protein
LELFKLLLGQGFFERTQVLDEQPAVDVVDLMAEHPGQRPRRRYLLIPALEVEPADLDLRRPADLLFDARNGEASLLGVDLAFLLDDLGVDQDVQLFGALADLKVHGDHPPADADLRCGQADPRGGVHGQHHVMGQCADLVVDLPHGLGAAVKDGVSVSDDLAYRHRPYFR